MQCLYCKEEIVDGAIKCKHCSSMLNSPQEAQAVAATVPTAASVGGQVAAVKPHWMSIASLVLGILSALLILNTGWVTYETALSFLIIGVGGIIFGSISLANKYPGKGLAIGGLVTGILGVLNAVVIFS